MIQIEADCVWAVANDTWSTDVRHKNTPEEMNDLNAETIEKQK